MKLTRYLRLFLTALTLGVLANVHVQAAIAEFAGSYEAKLASLENLGGETLTETFYGKIEVTVAAAKNNTATASGKLYTRAGKSYPFTTTFTQPEGSSDTSRQSIGVAPLKGTKGVFLINFFLTIKGDGSIVATGENFNPGDANATFFVAGSFKFAKFTGTSVPEWLGNYTMALINPSPSGSTVPAGAGYASLSVLKNGQLSYKGKTGDGAIITGTASPTATGDYSIFTIPKGYSAGGYLSTVINLVELGTQGEPAVWTKAANAKDKAYPAGFSTVVDVIVQEWFIPAKKTFPLSSAFGFAASKNFDVLFSGEGLSDGNYVPYLPKVARITGLSVIQAVSGGTGSPAENNSTEWNKLWNVKLNALTGVFTGTQKIKHLVGAKLVERSVPVEGVIVLGSSVSKLAFAYGQYAVPAKDGASTVTGQVTFHGPLVDNKAVATSGNYTVKIDETSFTDGSIATGSDTYVPTKKPARPAGSPADGQVVKFNISEDMQTLTFNGQVLTYLSEGFGGRLYQKVVFPKRLGQPNGQLAVTIRINETTGQVTYVSGFSQFITATAKSSREQSTVFEVMAPAASNIVKQP